MKSPVRAHRLVLLAVLAATALAVRLDAAPENVRVEKFKAPNIKSAFCGVKISYRYCKCAFHGKLCDSVNLSESAANAKVRGEYKKWVDEKRKRFRKSCLRRKGFWKPGKDECHLCKPPSKRGRSRCLKPDEEESPAAAAEGELDADCAVKASSFDENWRKYSDFDDRIPLAEKSHEVKQHHDLYEKKLEKMVEAFALERDMEIDRLARLELRRYREALVKGIKANLLKAFWRLAYVTYSTVKGGKGTGESYAGVLTSAEKVKKVGEALKAVRGVAPKGSALEIDTRSVSGKVKSVGVDAAAEALTGLGNPAKVAAKLFESAGNMAPPSADLTKEEIAILSNQHLDKLALDDALQTSYKVNSERRGRLEKLEVEIAELDRQIATWEAKEKARVRLLLEDSCKKQRAGGT